jgi:hypothetical protein
MAKKSGKKLPKEIDVHYLKTPNYRTFHVDGVFGGLTPNRFLYLELFLQRLATPQIIKHAVTNDGKLGEEIQRIGKKGLIREIEAGLVMDLQVAKILRDWLDKRIKEFSQKVGKTGQSK